jgi:N-acetylglucosaminyldiphosphoundecaprenol N-acetyl-beta-D-mannosaminyltransferase
VHLKSWTCLLIEPWRRWKRYLIGNPLFIWRVLKQRLGLLRFDEDAAP